jgi:hypothetical protein
MIEQFYRLASDDELAFYDSQLYPLQDRVFEEVAVFGDALYWTGGTALARVHFQHRLSDDLDFFTPTAQLPYLANELIARLQQRGLAVTVEQMTAWFVRFFVGGDAVQLKIDLVRDAQLTGPLIRLPQGIYTNSVSDIGANKITAFEDRAEIKDIIDLYYICQTVEMQSLFALADRKRVPVAYERLLTINQQGVSGRALLLKPVDAAELERFLRRLRAATEEEVKKKEIAARMEGERLIAGLLWDFPPEERTLSAVSRPVLRRRLAQLSLPHRRAVERLLNSNTASPFSWSNFAP